MLTSAWFSTESIRLLTVTHFDVLVLS